MAQVLGGETENYDAVPIPGAGRSLKINVVVGGRFHATQLYHSLTALGHDVHIYATSPARYFKGVPKNRVTFIPKPAQLLQKGLKIRAPRWVSEWSAVAFDGLVSRIMRPADLLWGFNGDSYLSAQRIKARGGIYVCDRACPHILTQEALLRQESVSTGYPYAPQTRRVLDRFQGEYRIADKIVVPSQYSAGSFFMHGIAPERVALAPLDANAPKPLAQEIEAIRFDGTSEGDILVGMVGGSFLRKGILYLLRAVAALERTEIRVLLRADKASVLSHAEARVLCDKLRVVFVPYLDDINKFYRSVDMFVLPSVDEGFGMVVYEALRMATPVIATDHVGAIDDMVPDRDFLKVPAQDADALGQAIARLTDDPELRARIGAQGRDFYRARMVGRGLYRKALAEILSPYVGGTA